jgi:anti-sigma regulatory factor (Ser/Thr protein kinase)
VTTSSLQARRAPVTLRVPFAASSVAEARHRLRDWMADSGLRTADIDDARIVISELIANSIRHAQPLPDGDLEITWHLEPHGLELAVTDGGGSTRPHKVHAPSSAVAGRGMAIVDNLTDNWWADRSRTRSTVHAIVRL